MRNLIYFLFLSTALACNSDGMLGQPFNRETYVDDLYFMLQKQQAGQEEVFNITYAVVRHRDYLNYQLEGKTYGEILQMAQTFRREGLPVEQTFDRNGEQDAVTATVRNEGPAFTRKDGSRTRLEKKLRFTVDYTNTSDEDLILLSTTFLFYGPFQDYLTSSAYQLNCLLEPGQRKTVNFLAEATNIRDNLLAGGDYGIAMLSMDSLLTNMDIRIGGISTTEDTRFFRDCRFGGARLHPVKNYVAKEEFDPAGQVTRDASGRATSINWGKAHYQISDSDKVLNMQGGGR